MVTVDELELQQKTSEYLNFVKNFVQERGFISGFSIVSDKENYRLQIVPSEKIVLVINLGV